MDYKLHIPRILMIDRELRSGLYPNCTSLSGMYEVTERTIRRDIEYMKDFFGAPVAYDKPRRGYYYSEPNFFLPALDMKESDFFALCISEKALRQYENTPFYDRLAAVFEKLKGFLPDTIRVNTTWIDTHYTFLQESYTGIDPGIWETIAGALRLGRQVRITHRKAGADEAVARTVDPYHIVNYRGEWYLVGYCHTRNDIVRFAVSRIKSASMLDTGYTLKENFSLNSLLSSAFGIMSEDREYAVTIRFSKTQAPYILERQWHASQTIQENSDGSVDLSFKTSSLFEVKRWVLSWGADAVVLEPGELVKDMGKEISAMNRNYGVQ